MVRGRVIRDRPNTVVVEREHDPEWAKRTLALVDEGKRVQVVNPGGSYINVFSVEWVINNDPEWIRRDAPDYKELK